MYVKNKACDPRFRPCVRGQLCRVPGIQKTFTVDEVKNIWIYELPESPSPLDAYVGLDLTPQQGVVGTLFSPNHLVKSDSVAPLLAEGWKWNPEKRELDLDLKNNLRFQNGDPILPAHFVGLRDYLNQRGVVLSSSPLWLAWSQAEIELGTFSLKFRFPKSLDSAGFDLEGFLSQVLTHPLSGAIHPRNLESIQKGELVKMPSFLAQWRTGETGWISSGPYKIRKWNPKEIELVSRDDFPVRLPSAFFRTLKYQSAPIKNPSCDFILGKSGEESLFTEHSAQPTEMELSVFWLCRSFKESGICQDPKLREAVAATMSGTVNQNGSVLQGRKVRYRIPVGSDNFRNEIRKQIEERFTKAGAVVEETSYFFKSSKETDLELQFVVTPAGDQRLEFAMSLGHLSSRLGLDVFNEKNLMGEVAHYPLKVFMKKMKGEIYGKVFLDPDLEEKHLPL
jgi:hypothetical protein